MKKYLLGLGFGLLGMFAQVQAQNGLERIVVEKYYISNAADAAASAGALPVGSVTYRIYADMLPGYKFQAAYGNDTHTCKFTTTTTFFNNEDRGAVNPTYTLTQAKANTVLLDSYLTAGGAASNRLGVLKSEDDATAHVVNSDGILANTDAALGIPLTSRDGISSSTTLPQPFKTIGFGGPAEDLEVFGATQFGGSFVTTGSSWYCENGAVGATASNMVLIAQMTTDGIFHYELNIQIGTPVAGVSQKYVNGTAASDETSLPSMVGTFGAPNSLPVVALAGATSAVVGEVKTYTATASDTDGTIANVVFKVNGTTAATVAYPGPYTFNYTTVLGNHSITAVATDDQGGVTTSAPVALIVTSAPVDPAPVVNIIAPAAAVTTKLGVAVAITATASDLGINNTPGTITQVEFFAGTTSLGNGVQGLAGYTVSFPASIVGEFAITAKATAGTQTTTSLPVSITVVANVAPVVAITAPTLSTVSVNTAVTLTATATDPDGGTITSVVFNVNNVAVGTPITTAPYTTSWTTPANEANNVVIEAIATDNNGGITTVSKSVNVVDPTKEKPYVIGTWDKINSVTDSIVEQKCYDTYVVRIPVSSTKTTMAGVIGYDMALNYDGRKLVPNGKIVLNKLGVDSTKVSYLTNIVTNADESKNVMHITIFLNGSALATDYFFGAGKLFSAEFNKRHTFSSAETVVFKIDTLYESYPTKIEKLKVRKGYFKTERETEFLGSLKHWKTEDPIKYNKTIPGDYLVTNITGNQDVAPLAPVKPDLDGKFTYMVENGPQINIDRDITVVDVHKVIMATDALAAAYMSNKNGLIFTPTAFTMIAADVNLDGKVTAGDASQINLRAVGKITQFVQVWNSTAEYWGAPSKDWLFISQAKMAADAKFNISATYPNDDLKGFSSNKVPKVTFNQAIPSVLADCPHYGTDVFFGILLGDANGDWNEFAEKGDGLKSAKINEDFVVLDFSKAVVEGNVVTVPVSVNSTLNELHAIDLGIYINDEKIENISVVPIPSENFATLDYGFNAETKKLDVAGFNFSSIPTENTFSLRITKKNSSDMLVASDFDGVQVNLTDNPMGDIISGTLKVVDQTTAISPDQFSNIAVYPNPAKDYLNIKVSEDSKVRIFDINGRLVIETAVQVGQKPINVQNLTNGVYMLKVYTNANSSPSTYKVIIQK